MTTILALIDHLVTSERFDELLSLASQLQQEGHFELSVHAYSTAVEALQRVTPKQLETIRALVAALSNLGQIYNARAEHPQAADSFNRALISADALRPIDPTFADLVTGELLINLGAEYRLLDQCDKAKSALERAVRIYEGFYRSNSSRWGRHYAAAQNNLGLALHDLGLFDDAHNHLHIALTIDLKRAAQNGPLIEELAKSYNNVARTLEATGKYSEACVHYSSAAVLHRISATSERPSAIAELGETLANWGACLALAGRAENGLELLREAHEVHTGLCDSTRGKSFLAYLGRTKHNLGKALVALGQFAHAETFLKDAIAVRRSANLLQDGAMKPTIALSLLSLADFYLLSGNYVAAADVCKEAFSVIRLVFNPSQLTHADIKAHAHITLAQVHFEHGNADAAARESGKAFALFRALRLRGAHRNGDGEHNALLSVASARVREG